MTNSSQHTNTETVSPLDAQSSSAGPAESNGLGFVRWIVFGLFGLGALSGLAEVIFQPSAEHRADLLMEHLRTVEQLRRSSQPDPQWSSDSAGSYPQTGYLPADTFGPPQSSFDSMPIDVSCGMCSGSGQAWCNHCSGRGYDFHSDYSSLLGGTRHTCTVCGGSGRKHCIDCGGRGRTSY